MNRPSRGERASAATMRYVGCLVLPIRMRRSFTTGFSLLRWHGVRANDRLRPARGRPSMVSLTGPREQVRVSALGESLTEAEVGEVGQALAAEAGHAVRAAQTGLVE